MKGNLWWCKECGEEPEWVFTVLGWVPMWMRGWPFLRRFYWQQADIDRAKAEAERLWEFHKGDEP